MFPARMEALERKANKVNHFRCLGITNLFVLGHVHQLFHFRCFNAISQNIISSPHSLA